MHHRLPTDPDARVPVRALGPIRIVDGDSKRSGRLSGWWNCLHPGSRGATIPRDGLIRRRLMRGLSRWTSEAVGL